VAKFRANHRAANWSLEILRSSNESVVYHVPSAVRRATDSTRWPVREALRGVPACAVLALSRHFGTAFSNPRMSLKGEVEAGAVPGSFVGFSDLFPVRNTAMAGAVGMWESRSDFQGLLETKGNLGLVFLVFHGPAFARRSPSPFRPRRLGGLRSWRLTKSIATEKRYLGEEAKSLNHSHIPAEGSATNWPPTNLLYLKFLRSSLAMRLAISLVTPRFSPKKRTFPWTRLSNSARPSLAVTEALTSTLVAPRTVVISRSTWLPSLNFSTVVCSVTRSGTPAAAQSPLRKTCWNVPASRTRSIRNS
jgi:hypothetical protein